MKQPLPFRRYRFQTGIPPSLLQDLLVQEIGGGAASRTSSEEAPPSYQGRVNTHGFEINRINAYRSTHMPLIRGRIISGPAGTEVEVTMRPHRQVFVFSSIWYLFLLCSSLLILLAATGGHLVRLLLLSVPLGLAVSSWLLTLAVFESDCLWARKSLEKTFSLVPPSSESTFLNAMEGSSVVR
jgi:hypothetical protein